MYRALWESTGRPELLCRHQRGERGCDETSLNGRTVTEGEGRVEVLLETQNSERVRVYTHKHTHGVSNIGALNNFPLL